ncbi:MAG: VTT domain-containing protein [Dehalococcoidales bacterium]|nr:VTT domain-containing protein [Dehalococcoidales bacterium]
MNQKPVEAKSIEEGKKSARRRLIFVVTLLLVIAITVALQLVYGLHPERLKELKSHFYLGAFLISIIGNATIIFPGAVLVMLSNLGILLYSSTGLYGPIVVGLVGGIGAAIGEITGYVAGYSGREIVERRKMYGRVEGWLRKWGAPAILLFSLIPFVFDLIGIAAGILRFPFWKFLLLCGLGRTILYTVFVTLAALGWKAILPFFG